MDREPARLTDCALIGHQESRAHLTRLVRSLRNPRLPALDDEQVHEILPWIPPSTALRGRFSSPVGREVRGTYVETFIAPEDLASGAFHGAIARVRQAIRCAAREGARIAALGGFTSIVLEGRGEAAPAGLALTTGNTLTSALIVKGVEHAAARLGIDLGRATLLVVGSTGDIGSACTRYLGRRVRTVLLCARNAERLWQQRAQMRDVETAASTRLEELLPHADIVVCAASMLGAAVDAGACKPDALVCDAGYPKNARGGKHVFWGGLGQCALWNLDLGPVYSFPAPRVMHGCLLEAVALALEGRFEPFSTGRGRITPERIDEMWAIAARHGIGLAPLFGPDGAWVT